MAKTTKKIRKPKRAKKPETKKEKVVQITLQLTEQMIRLLNAKAALAGWTEWLKGADTPSELDAGSVVGLVVLSEARGNLYENTHLATPHMWRGLIDVVPELREVYEAVFEKEGRKWVIKDSELVGQGNMRKIR